MQQTLGILLSLNTVRWVRAKSGQILGDNDILDDTVFDRVVSRGFIMMMMSLFNALGVLWKFTTFTW